MSRERKKRKTNYNRRIIEPCRAISVSYDNSEIRLRIMRILKRYSENSISSSFEKLI